MIMNHEALYKHFYPKSNKLNETAVACFRG